MSQHPNARLTPRGRETLVSRIGSGAGVAVRAPTPSEGERAAALSPFIDRYNWERPHSACGGIPPMSRIVGVNNVTAHNS